MKKLLSVLCLVLAMFISTSIAHISTASAQDVWAYSDEYGTTYVMTETIINAPEDVTVNVKKVASNGKVTINQIIFDRHTMSWLAQTFSGFRVIGPISDSKYASSIWRTVQPYLRK